MANSSPGPHSGDDTYDLIDDALAALAERRGAWLGDDLTAISLIASLIDQAERYLPELVTSARRNGHTWEQLAHALATSPDGARLRASLLSSQVARSPSSQPTCPLRSCWRGCTAWRRSATASVRSTLKPSAGARS